VIEKAPRISVGMPAYNDAGYVRTALDSLLGQTEKDIELIVSDNASTDGTAEICEEYAARDPRVRVFRQPENRGQAANFNLVLEKARGEYFMWASTDDRWAPTFMEVLRRALEADPRSIGAFGPFIFVDESGQPRCPPQPVTCTGASAFVRIARLSYHFDDSVEYGLFRRAPIAGVRLPTWWGVNAKTPYDISYPPLYAFVAAGGIAAVGGETLMFKRFRGTGRHYRPFSENAVGHFLAALLRNVNLWWECVRAVRQGSRSWLLALATAPVIGVRCAYNGLRSAPGVAKWVLRELLLKILGRRRLDSLRGRSGGA
jgi:glycosyltransferase involved in cell wall biosynthesis